MHMLLTFIQGIIIGMCNVIPGVSGGTVIVIFDMYDEFLSILSLNFKRTLKNWRFVVPVILGMLCGVLIFSKIITLLYSNFPVQTNYLFTGLIIGSIPLLVGYVFGKNKNNEDAVVAEKKTAGNIAGSIICILVGFVIIVAFYLLQQKLHVEKTGAVLPPFTWKRACIIFIAGIFGAITMIIPGISGSLVMLIMGVYPIVISAIPALFHPDTFVHALILLLPNGVGVLLGLLLGSWLIKQLLRKCQNQTYAVILGLIVGSIINIFPGFTCIESVGMGIGSVICLLFGAAIAFFGSKVQKKDLKKE